MKAIRLQVVLLALTLTLLSACQGAAEKGNAEIQAPVTNNGQGPEVTFEKEVHDFGKIISGERVAYGFRFSNTGSAPLLITGIRSGCGCTVGDYPKEPLMPGQDSRINVVFNSAGRRGFQSETVRVLTNSKESVVTLRITAEVLDR